MLLALWLYAAIEGVGSARELDRLCEIRRDFAWICGGVSVNYHTLADFRVQHERLLDKLFAQSIASLTRKGLVDVNLVAQDGMRIRASAGSDSFRREATPKDHLAKAEEHLAKLEAEQELNPAQLDARRQAAREKRQRLEKAVEQVQELAKTREKRKAGDGKSTRASSTDPEARRTKMPDGGTRPAYNAQFATDVVSGEDGGGEFEVEVSFAWPGGRMGECLCACERAVSVVRTRNSKGEIGAGAVRAVAQPAAVGVAASVACG